MAGNTIEDHKELWAAVERTGVTVQLNHPEHCDSGIAGWYSSLHGILMICQDESVKAFDHVGWTDNDLDTLRHEAHHVLQDCARGRVGDGMLEHTMTSQFLAEVAHANGMTRDEIRSIQQRYAAQGANRNTVRQEVEAFIVARGIDASTLASTLDKHCTL
ncbi:MAG: hypothetical protein EB165_07430 [Euryarchaeota archaeon]|nr:hypothetical protein [Euryarchaeota archaeon]